MATIPKTITIDTKPSTKTIEKLLIDFAKWEYKDDPEMTTDKIETKVGAFLIFKRWD